MNTLCKTFVSVMGALALSGSALAQYNEPSSSTSSMSTNGGMHGDTSGMKGMHHAIQGMHAMPATVTSVDSKTGVVEADTEGMSLKLHFPPASVANLKAGDKITLHLGFSKP
ncbi:hypothetical protein EKH80_07290 [Dyella choica]|uniref:Copper-binding protein n=2 Tax=Dyella choica TaxID=1927959 RepID=A0A3S0SB84_9GAMM|nr:hypothetical protein EKH80_07290 [Dyella choica]